MMVHLNRKLVLEQMLRSSDGAGGYVERWERLGVHWAQIKTGRGRERAESFGTVSSVPAEIIVRAAPQGSPKRPQADQRFLEGGRVFRIQSVSELDARGRYLSCYAIEEVAT